MSSAQTAFVLVIATLGGLAASAAETTEARDIAQRPAVLVSPATPAVAPQPAAIRAVSTDTAAKLATVAPKFEANAPKAAAREAGTSPETAPDLREIDKPRNTIVRLPRYLVQEDKPPVFKERELLTPQERLRSALQKHPGLRLGSFWIFRNDGIALFMQAEEERLERKREFEDLAGLLRLGDPAAHATAKREVQRAFMREPDYGYSP